MEYKATPAYIDNIQGRTVTGFTAVMGNLDDGNDIGHMGMFTKTINEGRKRVRHLWQHNSMLPPIAAIKSLQEVGRKQLPSELVRDFPDAEGALQVAREYLETERGEEVFKGVVSGALNEMSYGYDAIKAKPENRDGTKIRHLQEVRLYDTSDVNWGMNPATIAAKDGLSPYLIELVALSREWVDHPDALKAGRVLSARNLQRVKDAVAVLHEVMMAAEPPMDEIAEGLEDLAELTQEKALTESIRVRQRLQAMLEQSDNYLVR